MGAVESGLKGVADALRRVGGKACDCNDCEQGADQRAAQVTAEGANGRGYVWACGGLWAGTARARGAWRWGGRSSSCSCLKCMPAYVGMQAGEALGRR